MLEQILIVVVTSIVTAFSGWVFYIREHKAKAVAVEVSNEGAEKNNDRTEIENYKLIAQEWREAAQQWKDLADDYQTKLIEQSRKIEAFLEKVQTNDAELAANKKEIVKLRGLLEKANKRIAELERWEKQAKKMK